MRGCAPSCFDMSMASTHARAPFTSAAASEPAGPLRVRTVRLWTASEWVSRSAAPVANAVEMASIRRSSRPSEKLGTARSMRAIGALDEQLAVADDLAAVHGEGRLHHDAVEMDRHLDLAADPGRGAEGDVHGAQQLLVLEQLAAEDRLLVGPDAELRDARAIRARPP